MKSLFILLASTVLLSGQCQTAEKSAGKTSEISTEKSESMSNSTAATAPASNPNLQKATLGGGCFWCVEAIYQDLKGVVKVESGYSGGETKNPTYREICSGLTGHAEVVEVTFDPSVISYREILDIFFTTHDPTTLNRQGADVGTQYRSAIFYRTDAEKATAEAAKIAAAEIWEKKVVTEISKFSEFYKAEAYHQNYYKDNPYQGYCQAVIAPKVKKFREKYASKLKQ